MARNSGVINACFPLSIQPIEVPRYRAVNEEVALLPRTHNFFSSAASQEDAAIRARNFYAQYATIRSNIVSQ